MQASRKRRAPRTNEAPDTVVDRAAEANADTALNYLTPVERDRLNMDSWEPSLLRELLEAENRLPRKR